MFLEPVQGQRTECSRPHRGSSVVLPASPRVPSSQPPMPPVALLWGPARGSVCCPSPGSPATGGVGASSVVSWPLPGLGPLPHPPGTCWAPAARPPVCLCAVLRRGAWALLLTLPCETLGVTSVGHPCTPPPLWVPFPAVPTSVLVTVRGLSLHASVGPGSGG